MYSKVIQLYGLIYILFHTLFPYSLSQDTECSLVLYRRTLFIHLYVLVYIWERERVPQTLFQKHVKIFNTFSQNRRYYMFSCFLLPFNNVSWGYFQIKTFTASVFLFPKKYKFCSEKKYWFYYTWASGLIYLLFHVFWVSEWRGNTPCLMIKTVGFTWSLVPDIHTHTITSPWV